VNAVQDACLRYAAGDDREAARKQNSDAQLAKAAFRLPRLMIAKNRPAAYSDGNIVPLASTRRDEQHRTRR